MSLRLASSTSARACWMRSMNFGSFQCVSLNGDSGRSPCATCDRYTREAQEHGRRDELDGEPFLPGLLEQRLGLLEVLLALRQVARVHRVVTRVEVVGDRALAAEHLLHHLLAVDHEPERLAHT